MALLLAVCSVILGTATCGHTTPSPKKPIRPQTLNTVSAWGCLGASGPDLWCRTYFYRASVSGPRNQEVQHLGCRVWEQEFQKAVSRRGRKGRVYSKAFCDKSASEWAAPKVPKPRNSKPELKPLNRGRTVGFRLEKTKKRQQDGVSLAHMAVQSGPLRGAENAAGGLHYA